jgi:hypothetical protein
METPSSEEIWISTLREVSRQLCQEPSFESILDVCGGDELSHLDILGHEPWPQEQWYQSFKILVYEMPKSIERVTLKKDDLVFFVVEQEDRSAPRVLTRRRNASNEMPPDVDRLSGTAAYVVDWKQSLVLYIIMHTEYRFGVVVGPAGSLDAAIHAVMGSQNLSESKGHAVHSCLALPTLASDVTSEIIFPLEDVLRRIEIEMTMDAGTCVALVLGADIVHSWTVTSHQSRKTKDMSIVFSGFVPISQLKENLVSPITKKRGIPAPFEKLGNILEKLLLEVSAGQPKTTILRLRGHQDSGIVRLSMTIDERKIHCQALDLQLIHFRDIFSAIFHDLDIEGATAPSG